MKKDDIIDSLEYVEDDLLEEADRTRNTPGSGDSSEKVTPIRKNRASARRWGTLAASLAVLVIAGFIITGVLRTRNAGMDTMQSAQAEKAEAVQEMAEAAEEEAVEAPAEAYEAEEAAAPAEAVEEAAAPAEAYEMEEAAAAEESADMAEPTAEEGADAMTEEDVSSVQIRVTSDAGEVIFALNDTPAAKSLLAQLPLTVDTEPYSNNEIIFYPDEPLDTEDGLEGGGTAGYLGYFAPWNDVVMYYGDFSEYPGLYILGEAVSGAENIEKITGQITIDIV